MDWPDILTRIRAGESETTEFKRWEAFPDRVADAICALANSQGGVLLLGVSDTGAIAGVPLAPDQVQERLTTLLHQGLNAPVSARLGQHQDAAGSVHWIEIPRQRSLEPWRRHGRVLVRRGRSSVEPSPAELQDLYNTFGFVLTEEQRVPGSGLGDIDVEAFRGFLTAQGLDLAEAPQPDLIDDLRNRGVLTTTPDGVAATLYGILGFGREPQRFAPLTSSHFIDCVAYAGTDRADAVILAAQARGRIDEQVQRAQAWIAALGHREEYAGLHRTCLPVVPPKALREVLVNAVVHRDYAILGARTLLEVFADRVVVTSPGALPNHMTPASALAGGYPRSRNELLANFMFVRRFMEGRGRGLPIVRRAMHTFNGTAPELLSDRDSRFVRITLQTTPLPTPPPGGCGRG